jgi:hypothetical protein
VCVCVYARARAVKLCDILTVNCVHCVTESAICNLVSFVLCKYHVEVWLEYTAQDGKAQSL